MADATPSSDSNQENRSPVDGKENSLEHPPKLSATENPSEPKPTRLCWICRETEEEAPIGWTRACRCKGTFEWCHEECMLAMINAKRMNATTPIVTCTMCKFAYRVLPEAGVFLTVLDVCDRLLYALSPLTLRLVGITTMYCGCFCYGYLTTFQILGQNEGSKLLRNFATKYICLPAIPVILFICKRFKWADKVLDAWINDGLPTIIPFIPKSPGRRIPVSREWATLREPFEGIALTTRDTCGALLLPTMSQIAGYLFFPFIRSNLRRTLLGGAAFIFVTGALKIRLRQQQYIEKVTGRLHCQNGSETASSPSTEIQ